MKTSFLKTRLIAIILSMALVSVASAQNTAATIRGTIADASGAPIANATVIITHESTGTVATARTGADGNYYQPGLRVGGPYTVGITASGFQARKINEIYLSPGSQSPMDLVLNPASSEIEEIIVTAVPTSARDLNNGIGSNFTATDIANTPSTKRDIMATMMRDPLAQSNEEGHLVVAGTNPRMNGFAIDGALQTDDFGLNNNNDEGVYSSYGTVRSPINMDAVESASLVASDYDVGTGGFTGGLVTLTTKSGTNDWDGSAFYYKQTDDMWGNDLPDGGTYDPGPIDEKEYGVTLGGPIVKDKLFFFVSYDEFESASSTDFTNTDESNGFEPGFFDELRTIITNSLGYDPGPRPVQASTPSTSERLLVKLDWNVSDLHRASYTYQSSEEFGSSVSAFSFSSGWYTVPLELEAHTLQFYSDWNDRFSTTLRANFKDFSRGQICNAGSDYGHLEFDILVADTIGTSLDGLLTDDASNLQAGCDRFRHANDYSDDRTQILLRGDYLAGNHVISAGVEFEEFNVFNLFISGGANGRFQYDSYADILTATASVNYENDVSNDKANAAQSWGYDKITFFAQDTIQLTPDFELSLGLRYEQYDQSDSPEFSQTIMDTYGVDTSNNLDGRDVILPRISFRWNISDRTTLTGGIGRFAGGDPKVWTSAAFALPTVFTNDFLCGAGPFPGVDGSVVPAALQACVAAGTPVNIDYISKDFEVPSDWKTSLRIDYEWGDGYLVNAQYLYTQTEDGFNWTNLAQTALSTGVAPDGRPIYADLDDLGIANLTELGNHSEGESQVLSVGISKFYDFGLDFTFSYAWQDIELGTEGSSSRGVSNWRSIFTSDRNNVSAHRSRYETEHSFKLNLGYQKDFFGSGQSMTRFDTFIRRFSGDAYAVTFDVDSRDPSVLFGRAGNGESPYDDDTVYVPTSGSDPAVVYAAGFNQAAFNEFADKHIKGNGIIAPTTSTTGWVTTMDLRIQQDIPGLSFLRNSLGDNNFRIVLDVENFLNLLNSDWGNVTEGPGFVDHDIIEADMVLASDVLLNGVDGATALVGDEPRTMCLQQSDCVYRYERFNDKSFQFTNRAKSVYNIRLGVRFDF